MASGMSQRSAPVEALRGEGTNLPPEPVYNNIGNACSQSAMQAGSVSDHLQQLRLAVEKFSQSVEAGTIGPPHF